jgi:hypothetical protein
MSIKTTLKTSVAAAALFAVAAPVVSGPAEAGLANGNDNGVVISGSLNRALQYVDNGVANDWIQTDGGTDNSRLRILVSGQLTESIAVGGTWEANLPNSQPQGSTTTTDTGAQGGVTAGADAGFTLRVSEISFKHATMGQLTIGQGSTSSDNKPGMGSTTSGNAGMSHGGSVRVWDKTANANSALTAGSQFASYFGGKDDRVRYDTPSIMGFTASASAIDNNSYDFGVAYNAVMGDLTYTVRGSMKHFDSGAPSEAYGVGAAVKHASGLSASAHYGEESGTGAAAGDAADGIEGSAWGVEAGYTTTAINGLGATSFEVIYVESDEAIANDTEAELIAFHVDQQMPAGVNVYASYELAEFDDNNTATDLEDVSVFLIGTRLKF